MVERTSEFKELFSLDGGENRIMEHSSSSSSFSPSSSSSSYSSPFVLNAGILLSRIEEMLKVANESFIPYTGCHSHMKKYRSVFLEENDRRSLEQDISIFVATCASDVHALGEHSDPRNDEHHKAIIGFLIDVRTLTHVQLDIIYITK